MEEKKIFNKESMDFIFSPEKTDDYIRRLKANLWILLVADVLAVLTFILLLVIELA